MNQLDSILFHLFLVLRLNEYDLVWFLNGSDNLILSGFYSGIYCCECRLSFLLLYFSKFRVASDAHPGLVLWAKGRGFSVLKFIISSSTKDRQLQFEITVRLIIKCDVAVVDYYHKKCLQFNHSTVKKEKVFPNQII